MEDKKDAKKTESEGGVSLALAASKTWTTGEDEATVMVSVSPPTGVKPTPCDICCVVDISGSMQTEAATQDTSGHKESHGLSILDVVKHAVKTIVEILQPEDRLSLVTYSNSAEIVFDLIPMDKKGQAKALKSVEQMKPDGQTNLWDGLQKGMEVIRKSSTKGRLAAVLLLTDGQPNVVPPEGHIPALKKYKDVNKISCTINTFGFGYNLDSALLKDIAIEGNGMYAFIPDSGFVGTAFVNATSNLLATMAKNVTLNLEPLHEAKIEGAIGGYPILHTSWGAMVTMGSLQFEQTKNVLVRLKLPKGAALDKSYVRVTLKYETADKAVECSAEGGISDPSQEGEIEVQRHRLAAVDVMRQGIEFMKSNKSKQALEDVKALIKEIQASSSAKNDKRVQELLKDLEGQVVEAFSRTDYFTKWGVHYLPSLINAHLLQMCNNFKDPGVQVYGGKLFEKLRDRADDIFIKLPPPKPSYDPTAAPVSSMNVYHSSSAPCFHGNCMVQMSNGGTKSVKEIAKGDRVMTSSRDKSAEVLCVVKTHCDQGMTDLVELEGGLLITPYHPVRLDSKWSFPCDLAETKNTPCDAVYSFALKEDHVMVINGVSCVTLGHRFQEEVVKHPYFGSQKVIDDLQKLNGWNSGLVELQPGCLVRDNNTSLVCGLHQ